VTPLAAGGRVGSGSQTLSGLALLRKPAGITSFQALFPIKKALGSGKVGHAGTLDRFAEGLLIALVGSYSRLAPYVVAGEKLYRGLAAFGAETDTLDPEGKVIAEAPLPSRAGLEAALDRFRGPIMQLPPAYSALHVGGKRAYEIAMKGEVPALKERRVEIFRLELLSYERGEALLEVRCSSGTYIRSLARDIALSCGSRAHLRALERLSIGPFEVGEAVSPEAFDPAKDLRAFSPRDAAALGLQALSLEGAAEIGRFKNGGRISPKAFAPINGVGPSDAFGLAKPESAVFDGSGLLLGLIDLGSDGPRYKVVMPITGGQGA
jgi:tRNA pseudouridine55 synthase